MYTMIVSMTFSTPSTEKATSRPWALASPSLSMVTVYFNVSPSIGATIEAVHLSMKGWGRYGLTSISTSVLEVPPNSSVATIVMLCHPSDSSKSKAICSLSRPSTSEVQENVSSSSSGSKLPAALNGM